MRSLVVPSEIGLEIQDSYEPLPQCVSEWAVRSVPVKESGEPLQHVASLVSTMPIYSSDHFHLQPAGRSLLLRATVIKKLHAASAELPTGFGILVLDGWRSVEFQRELVRYYANRRGAPFSHYVADPSDDILIAPHTTGGAVDLTLTYRGTPLALGSDFDEFNESGHLHALENASKLSIDAKLRRLLAKVLTQQNIAPYPWEWWHWSFGDQRWAAQYNAAAALYGKSLWHE